MASDFWYEAIGDCAESADVELTKEQQIVMASRIEGWYEDYRNFSYQPPDSEYYDALERKHVNLAKQSEQDFQSRLNDKDAIIEELRRTNDRLRWRIEELKESGHR